MSNENLEKILDDLTKILKQQSSLKNNITDITPFIQSSFKEQREKEKQKFNELSKKIDKELENKIQDIEKNILKEIENRRKIVKNNNGNSIIKSRVTNPNYNNDYDDNSQTKINNGNNEKNEFSIFNKQINNNQKVYKMKILSDDINITLKQSELEEKNDIPFEITIINEDDEKLPSNTYITFENKNKKLKFKQFIKELEYKEVITYSCKIKIEDKEIKEDYETNIIIKNKNYKIKCEPIKFILKIKKKKDYLSNDGRENDSSSDSDNIVDEKDFKNIMKALNDKINYQYTNKSNKKINNSVNKHKDLYLKYKKENDDKKKKKNFNSLIDEIAKDLKK